MITLERHTVSPVWCTLYTRAGGNAFFQNVSGCLPDYMASHFGSQSP